MGRLVWLGCSPMSQCRLERIVIERPMDFDRVLNIGTDAQEVVIKGNDNAGMVNSVQDLN